MVLIAGLLVAACASPTPHVPASRLGGPGYTEERLATDHFRVGFRGNAATDRATVERSALYQAARVTLREGGDWFEIAARDVERDVRLFSTLDPFVGRRFLVRDRFGVVRRRRFAGSRFGTGTVREIESFEAIVEFRVRSGAFPDPAPAESFLASDVVETLGGRILSDPNAAVAAPALD